MANLMDLKMATVTEEDFDDDECEIDEDLGNSYYDLFSDKDRDKSDKKPIEDLNIKTSKEFSSEIHEDHPILERSSSVVEKDLESTLSKEVLDSLTKPIDSKNNSINRSNRSRSVDKLKNRNAKVSIAIRSPTTVTPLNVSKTRRVSNSITISMREKFVTELSLNTDTEKGLAINLGLFLSTSRRFGDHSIYKISPISPFKSTSLSPQDRILKINDFEVSNWSHFSIVNLIRNLPLTSYRNSKTPNKEVTELALSLEFLPVSETLNSADQGPFVERAEIVLRTATNGRMVVGCFSRSRTQTVIYRNECTKQLQCVDYSGLLLKAEDAPLRISLEVLQAEERNYNLKFHIFETVPTTRDGIIVAIEIFKPGYFLQASNSTSGSPITIARSVDGSDIRNLTRVDNRLFKKLSNVGESRFTLQNIETELYLQANLSSNSSSLTLEYKSEGEFPTKMLFEEFSNS